MSDNQQARALVANMLMRNFLSSIQPYSVDAKRPTAWADYGYPDYIPFSDYWSMYRRNGIAKAMVERKVDRAWQTYPTLLENEDPHDMTPWEREVKELFDRTRFWKMLKGTDMRNRVGKYSGLIYIFADNKRPDEPVDRVPGGIRGLVKVIPCYESQLKPSQWDTNPQSPTYGEPSMYQFNETAIGDHSGQNPGRVMTVHPSRVQIWAEGADDGTIYGVPCLQGGFNALLTCEKIVGAGGEGFWKTARAPMKLNIDKEADLPNLAKMLGTDVEGMADKLDEVLADFNSGLDKGLSLQGIDAQNLTITLPDPKEFFNIALQEAAASENYPLPVLIGNQTGERASTEDAKEYDSIVMSRRETFVIPQINDCIRYLMQVGVIKPKKDWYLDWPDLTEQTLSEKLDNAKKMSETNRNMMGSGEPVPFTAEQIADTGGFEFSGGDVATFGEGEE